MSGLKFELVAPEKLLVSRPVGMVTVPGEEGDFGVLPGHAPLVSTLRTGVVTIHDEGRITDQYFVAGGFAEVSAERCTVLAEEAMPLSELNRTAIDMDTKRLQDELLVAASDGDRERLKRRLALNEAKVKLAA